MEERGIHIERMKVGGGTSVKERERERERERVENIGFRTPPSLYRDINL